MTMDVTLGGRLAALALACVHRPYPYHVSHVAQDDADLGPPRALWPAFHGAFDWHSAVHGHWTLARLSRLFPDAPFAEDARAALARSLDARNVEVELAYLEAHPGFERPYGLAWLLALAGEHAGLDALAALAAGRLATYFAALPFPVRSGEHGQSAFAMGLALDWARAAGAGELARVVEDRARVFYGRDVAAPVAYEPSGHDFLSPALAAADLLRRVLDAGEFARWLDAYMPDLALGAPLSPVTSPDPADGKLAHLDGLCLSRAWMMRGIASVLPATDARRAILDASALEHREAGLARVTAEHYMASHWLASFACYLVTDAGL